MLFVFISIFISFVITLCLSTMNAIIGLCHFCEAHGPRPVFCTFTTNEESHTTEFTKNTSQCSGCTSLGHDTVYVSRDDYGTLYCSRESVPNEETATFLRQAAVRSITCEVSWSKKGGVVFFSEAKGHILSYTFQLCDTWSRGLQRWFSFVVLMKDKMLLLNLTLMLSDYMQKVSKELQELAEAVYNIEQSVCSQRSLRLNTGRNDFGPTRSLVQLTGDEQVFKKLHTHFTWMLKAGSITYLETLHTSQDLLRKLDLGTPNDTSIFNEDICLVPSDNECMPLRALESLLKRDVFRILLYCTLIGVEITIKTHSTPAIEIARSISRILPLTNEEPSPNIKTCSHGDVVTAVRGCLLFDTAPRLFSCNWTGTLPSKKPTLMSRIETAMANEKFTDNVLHQHIKALQLEWLGKVKSIKSAVESAGHNSEAVRTLKKICGIAEQDNPIAEYWMRAFC